MYDNLVLFSYIIRLSNVISQCFALLCMRVCVAVKVCLIVCNCDSPVKSSHLIQGVSTRRFNLAH